MKLSWIFIFGIFMLNACSKEEQLCEDCLDYMLEEHDMLKYNNQQISCDDSYMILYQSDTKQYFKITGPCFCGISYTFDCEHNIIKVDADNELSKDFRKKAREMGIVGINKK